MPSPSELHRLQQEYMDRLRAEHKELEMKEMQNKLWQLERERDKIIKKEKSHLDKFMQLLAEFGILSDTEEYSTLQGITIVRHNNIAYTFKDGDFQYVRAE